MNGNISYGQACLDMIRIRTHACIYKWKHWFIECYKCVLASIKRMGKLKLPFPSWIINIHKGKYVSGGHKRVEIYKKHVKMYMEIQILKVRH